MKNSQETFDARWSETGLASDAPVGETLHHRGPSVAPDLGGVPALELGGGTGLVREELLGEGGMGIVWTARDLVLGRLVALKQAKATGGRAAAAALLAEARTLAGLEHPNIVPVHALGVLEDGAPGVVMKRVTGTPWSDRLTPPPRGDALVDAIDTLLAVCDALRFAHSRGVLHRDVKPENVMIGAFGEVYLMDWGCACAAHDARTNPIVGTTSYLAPEMRAPGAPVDVRTDVYLLGATLHHVLTGEPRHHVRTLREAFAAAQASEPAVYATDVPPELGDLANRACARRPEDRPPDSAAFAAALRGWMRHQDAERTAAEAARRLPALEAAVATDDPRAEALWAECRFGFDLALERSPGSQAALAGRDRALALYVPWKIARGDLAAAGALLADLPGPDADAWRARLAAAVAARDEAERAVREGDMGRSAGGRRAAALVLAAAGLLIPWFVPPAEALSPGDVAFLGGVSFTLVAGVTLAFRRTILVNAASRGLALAMVLLLGGLFYNRLLAWVADTGAIDTIRADLAWLAGAVAALGATTRPRLAWGALPAAAGALVVTIWPERAVGALAVAFVGLIAVLVWEADPRAPSGAPAPRG